MSRNPQRQSQRNTPKPARTVDFGGQRHARLAGKGRTLPAEERPWHKAYTGDGPLPRRTRWKQEKEQRKAATDRRSAKAGVPVAQTTRARVPAKRTPATPRVVPGGRAPAAKEAPELLVGRNPVVEALRASVPATTLYLAVGIDKDERIREAVRVASERGIPLLRVARTELDRMTGGVLHQGIGLQVPPYAYELFDDLLAAAAEQAEPLLVALDGVTDPRNLGAVLRSAAAFGAHGVFLAARRSVGVTATAWRTSAGAAARVPVAQVPNLTRAIRTCQERGFTAIGLDADGDTSLYDLPAAIGPLVVVVGSEGRGLSRLVSAVCDLRVSIPMAGPVESLNVSVAAAVALAEVARRRASDSRMG